MDPTILIPIALGVLAGFFINYISDVLPHTRRFSQPVCLHCQTPFSWMNYLTLRACKQCNTGRSLRTWLVLILTSASFAYFWLNPPRSLGLPLSLIVLTYFAVIIVIDLEHRLILFPTSVFGAALGLFAGTVLYWKGFGLSIATAVGSSLLGGVIGFAVMFLLYQFGALVARYRARKMQAEGHVDDEEEALGGGDVYLAGVLGLMVGSRFILFALIYGILIGGAVSIIFILALLLQRRYASQSLMTFIPYGPYLIAGAFYMLFLG
jgi:prepilin signal peptidase PulO-like enzyme (type II secretory pathway)